MQEEDLLKKVKHLFYGKVSFLEAVVLILQLALIDVFKVSKNKRLSIAGAVIGAISALCGALLFAPDKAMYLYFIAGATACLFVAGGLNMVFGKGGFFSYALYAGGLPVVFLFTPLIAIVCAAKYTNRYVSFRYDLPYNYSGRLTGVKGTGRKSR